MQQPSTITLEQYYAWSAEHIDAMRTEILSLIATFRRECGHILPVEDDGIEPAMLDDMAGLLGFLGSVPDGPVTYANDVAILAIRHDCSNALVRVFARAQFLPKEHPVRERFGILFTRLQQLRSVRHAIVEHPQKP